MVENNMGADANDTTGRTPKNGSHTANIRPEPASDAGRRLCVQVKKQKEIGKKDTHIQVLHRPEMYRRNKDK